jgi:hypothetical protein
MALIQIEMALFIQALQVDQLLMEVVETAGEVAGNVALWMPEIQCSQVELVVGVAVQLLP